MHVHIDASHNVTLKSPEDFKRFSVEIDGDKTNLQQLQLVAKVAGELVDGETMWVSQDWLRQAPACAESQQWQEGLTAMIDFARKHGWVRDSNGDVRAHVVWNPPR